MPKNKKKRDLEEFWIKRALRAEQQNGLLLTQLEATEKELAEQQVAFLLKHLGLDKEKA